MSLEEWKEINSLKSKSMIQKEVLKLKISSKLKSVSDNYNMGFRIIQYEITIPQVDLQCYITQQKVIKLKSDTLMIFEN